MHHWTFLAVPEGDGRSYLLAVCGDCGEIRKRVTGNRVQIDLSGECEPPSEPERAEPLVG